MRLKVGDVVSYNNEAGELILAYVKREKDRVRLNCKGVIAIVGGGFYTVDWFRNQGRTTNEAIELELCKGVKNSHLCKQCIFKFECWATRRR